jgi:hypothetical protein
MIGSLITSNTRIKLLKKFFLNSKTNAHLRGLENEFGESTNSIRIELNRLEGAGLLTSKFDGNKKFYKANSDHPLFADIHNIILKETGIDRVIEKVIHRLGSLLSVYLTGDFAKGKDSQVIELILVGNDIDQEYLSRKIIQAEEMVGRRVSCTVFSESEIKEHLDLLNPSEFLLLWSNGKEEVN